MVNKKIQNNKGILTIELLIAFAILLINITGIVMLTFGGQSLAVGSETSTEALSLAQQKIESAKAHAKNDFESLASSSNSSDIYNIVFNVQSISDCLKQITSTVTWNALGSNHIELSTQVANPKIIDSLGGFCSFTNPDDWDTPDTLGALLPGDFDGRGTGISISYINGERYAFLITDESSPNTDKYNFYIVNVSDPDNITSSDIHSIKVAEASLATITVAKVNGNTYAYIFANTDTDQLYIYDVTTPSSPTQIGTPINIPNISPGEHAVPLSSAFYDGKIYVGTEYLAFGAPGFNHELHALNAISFMWEGSINVNRNVNDIYIKNNIAYLATGPGSSPFTPLQIYNLSSGAKIAEFSSGSNKPGTAIYGLGKFLYLGTAGSKLYILDASNVGSNPIQKSLSSLGGSNTFISEIKVQGPYAFVGVNNTASQHVFQIWDIKNAASPFRTNTCTAGDPLPQDPKSFVYDNDYIFTAFQDNTPFKILYDTADQCEI